MQYQNKTDLSNFRTCDTCRRLIAPGYVDCLHCQNRRLLRWKEPRTYLLPELKQHLEGGKPFFIASGVILFVVIWYLLYLV